MHTLKPKVPVYASFVAIRLIYMHVIALDPDNDLNDSSLHAVLCSVTFTKLLPIKGVGHAVCWPEWDCSPVQLAAFI